MKPFPFVVFALVAIVSATAEECAITQGFNPVYSPDGARIAFQRLEGGVFKIGVVELPERGRPASIDESSVHWIEAGPGNAAYPAWTPDGALVYTWGHDAETAREAWKAGSQSGYGLRLREPDGSKRDLTRGRCRDYAPCVSPDGRTVWFVTTRGVSSESASFSKAAATRLAALDLARGGEGAQVPGEEGGASPPGEPPASPPLPRIVLDSPHGSNSGYVQPAVSPDGRFLVWGQLDDFFEGWRVYGARVADLDARTGSGGARPPAARVSPAALAALSPRWHPDGRTICFTGFRAGDPSWGVWVEDVYTGKVRRLATGENPCFSPDGAFLAYDRDGVAYERPYDPSVLEGEADSGPPCSDSPPSRIVWSCGGVERETESVLSGDPGLAFGDDRVFFVRAAVRLAPGGGVREFARGVYAEHPRAFQLYSDKTGFHFVSRDPSGKYFAAHAAVPGGPSGEHRLVAVREPTRILLSVDGAAPAVAVPGAALPLDTPLSIVAGGGFGPGDAVDHLDIGTGWPPELPKAPTREDLFK